MNVIRKLLNLWIRCAGLFLAAATAFCLYACAQKTPDAPAVSDPEANAFDLIQHVYTDTELDEIDAQAQELTLKELHARYPVECVRDAGDGSDCCVCYYASEDRLLSLYFDADGNYVAILNRMHPLLSDEEADMIQIGESVSDIRERLPDGDYLFLYTGRSDVPRNSVFYTCSGYRIIVRYDDDMKVSSIVKELY